jgi:hypothetical protein
MSQQQMVNWPNLRLGIPGSRMSQLTIAAALVVGLGVLIAGIVLGVRGAAHPLKAGAAPPWQAGRVACPADPLDSVHDPERLLLVARCATVSGDVTRLKIDPVSGELQVFLTVDNADVTYLRAGNSSGTLVARVSVKTIPTLTAPALHGHAVLYGAWVVNRARNAAELYPTYAIDPLGKSGTTPASKVTSAAAPIKLRMSLPASAPAGGAVDIVLNAQHQKGKRMEPVSQLHALVQISGPAGQGLRWRAAVTNTQGNAYVRLVLLQPPGQYLVTVFGYKGSETVSASGPITIHSS